MNRSDKKGKRTGKRFVALFSAAVLLTGALGGCGKKDGGNFKEAFQQEKGRYVETEITLPEEWTGSSIRQIFRVDDSVHLLLSRNEEEQTVLQEWTLGEDGNFSEVTKEWLAGLHFPYEEYGTLKLMQDPAGEQYLYACYSDETNQYYQGHLWKEADGQALDITPEKWKKPNEEYGYYEYVQDIAMLDNGTLAGCSFLNTLDRFLAGDGSFINSESLDNYYMEDVCSAGNSFYLLMTDQTMSVNAVEVWNFANGVSRETIPFTQESMGSIYLDVLPDGTMTIMDKDGIFQCKAGETDWKKIMEGSDTSFAITTAWCTGITTLSDGSFYALFHKEDDSQQILKYQYDPEAVVEVTETLTLYTITESFLLQNAAVLYHKEHPEVLIQIESAYSDLESYTKEIDYQQIYQDLNTRMTAGNAADILVLDHLNIDTYASKGLLVDISDVVEPMEQDGSLMANVTGAYAQEDGSRYVVPLQFGIQLAVGRGIEEKEMESLKNLAASLPEKTENCMGEQTVEELVAKFYPYFAQDLVQDKKLNREVLAEKLEYLKAIGDKCGIVEKHPDEGRAYNIWDIASNGRLAFYETGGFNQAMLPISAAQLVDGTYTGFEQAFLPSLQIGIYSKSQYQETAKDFLRFALSEKVQGHDYYEGFPVNTASLEKIAASDRSNMEAVTTIDVGEGVMEEFEIKDFSKEDAERLLEICRNVHVMAREDNKIKEELVAALPDYLAGNASLEETMDKIEGGLKMYLAE